MEPFIFSTQAVCSFIFDIASIVILAGAVKYGNQRTTGE